MFRKHDYFVDLPELETFINVYKREHADEFIKYWMKEYEPVLWSCGNPIYVNRIMDMIWPEFPKDHIFTQDQCNLLELEEEGIEGYFKDVDRLGRDLKRLIYVDGKPL